jgi:hypothetical protein
VIFTRIKLSRTVANNMQAEQSFPASDEDFLRHAVSQFRLHDDQQAPIPADVLLLVGPLRVTSSLINDNAKISDNLFFLPFATS